MSEQPTQEELNRELTNQIQSNHQAENEVIQEPPKERAKFARAIFRGLRSIGNSGGGAAKKRIVKGIEKANLNEERFQEARAKRRLEDKEYKLRFEEASRKRARLANLRKFGAHPNRTKAARFALRVGKRLTKNSAKRKSRNPYPARVYSYHFSIGQSSNSQTSRKGPTWKKLEFD